MYAKKSLGQNFLHNQGVIRTVVISAGVFAGAHVLEIGPGHGALTAEMLAAGLRVTAVEADKNLCEILEKRFETEITAGTCVVIHADITEYDESQMIMTSGDRGYHVIANIPYYLSGFIFRKFLSSNHQPKSMTLVVQKEVAERIVARDDKESLLSLSVKVYGNPIVKGKISAGSFSPAPKVDSAIIHIADISKKNFTNQTQEELFFKIIKTAFAHKRKQLVTNLKPIINDLGEEKLDKIFSELNLPETVRAEDINLSQWLALTRKYESCIIERI